PMVRPTAPASVTVSQPESVPAASPESATSSQSTAVAASVSSDEVAPAIQAVPTEDADFRPKPGPLSPSNAKKRENIEPTGPRVIPPSLRAPLSDELEQELAESLGDMSLDEILDADKRGQTASVQLEAEAKVKGRILRIYRDDVFVELPGMQQGSLSLQLFSTPPEIGTVVDLRIGRFNADDGLYDLTLPGGAVDVGDWSDINEGMTVEAHITGANKGGLECDVNHIRGFIPAGQVSLYRVEDFSEFVGQRFACMVTEANPSRRNLVLSRRAVLERDQAESKQRLLGELAVGQEREGIVRSVRDFGAFVDLGGIDGMLHVSQLSWDRIKHPSDVLTLGQKIKVKIQKIDPETGKIGLSYRETFESPWAQASTKFPVSAVVSGTVTKVMDFGAFVRLDSGVEGLVHISELSHKRVFRVSDMLKEGQEVEVKIVSVDTEAQRIGLSLKALEARIEPAKKAGAPAEEEAPLPPIQKHKGPLKGGTGKGTGGEQFGLKW
ncbi:MAG: S1 RNA-binding domain-containing protein, partial [Planctomycetota bacterium]|nr:S1 RNA-binding domain-containing protein [Planctomycetota bacterium]